MTNQDLALWFRCRLPDRHWLSDRHSGGTCV